MNNLNKTLPKEYEEYHPKTIRYDCVNEGTDPECGLWGTIDGLRPTHIASGHSSFISEVRETILELHKRDNPKDKFYRKFMFEILKLQGSFHSSKPAIYNANGIITVTTKEINETYGGYWTNV